MSEAAILQKCLDDIAESGRLYKKACDRLREVAEGIRSKSATSLKDSMVPRRIPNAVPGPKHSPEALDKQKFRTGQTAFFLDQSGRAHDCIIDGYRRDEILVSKDGKPLGWFSDDTLFHSTTEAYAPIIR